MVLKSSNTPQTHCKYCGNNPVNHTVTYLSQTLSVYVIPFFRPLGFMEDKVFQKLGEKMITGFLLVFKFLGAIQFSDKTRKSLSDRSQVMWDEAVARGIPMEQALFMGKSSEQYRARIKGRWHYFMSLPIPSTFDRRSHLWMDDKVLLKKFFLEKGVMVPKGGRATSWKQAEKIFDTVQKPVIVKPEIGSRGRHTTTHIYTKEELKQAFIVAQQLCHFVVVEEHLTGSVYRGTYVGGEVVGIGTF